ncbi:RNase H-domain-containing protein [Fomitopsis serialis]|uniref:RNase H-domain-containing protein n=1 Tax=Fomitopsis serialis TaxID=139415 RepID=UPI002008AC69|nr:RNase H-domain-containing protein [Neoantrodia serialis]KAH9907668.1 RNase H-domain-containing protein [Neoantrodia serialis]
MATDGSCYDNGSANARAGAGGYAGEENEDNFSLRLPPEIPQSNQTGELVAVSEACRRIDAKHPLKIISDSKYTIAEATNLRQLHEDRGYIGVANATVIRAMIGNLRSRREGTRFKWVKGHKGHALNEGADKLAGIGAQKHDPDVISTSVEAELRVSGAKLTLITQKLAYRGIREIKMEGYTQRRRTRDNIIRSVDNIEVFFHETPSEAQLWKGMRHKDIRKEVRYFLWMSMHDAYMVGTNWLRPSYSEELQRRHECSVCGQPESMDHILSECEAPGQREVWQLAKQLWDKKCALWPRPSLGAVLSCPIAPFKTDKGKPKTGETRLYRILMTESAYLIWKLRNERVIVDEDHPRGSPATPTEIESRWLQAINERLTLDCKMTDEKKYGKKAIKRLTVERTWGRTLKDESQLPGDWSRSGTGVLVGIERGQLRGEGAPEIRWSDDGAPD